MEIHWFEGILYGFISGIAEFLPISSQAHGAILRKLFGMDSDISLIRLLIHIGSLAALLTFMRGHLTILRKQASLKKIPSRLRKRYPDPRYTSELALLKVASVPLIIALLFYTQTVAWSNRLQWIAIFSAINGIVLLLPTLLPAGNKDARGTSILDRLMIGLASALSVFPGISRIALVNSVASMRGVDSQNAYNWSLLLSIPALAVMLCWDVFLVATSGTTVTFLLILTALLGAGFAFAGTWLSVSWMHSLVQKTSVSNFGYYSFGIALFAFILYLI